MYVFEMRFGAAQPRRAERTVIAARAPRAPMNTWCVGEAGEEMCERDDGDESE